MNALDKIEKEADNFIHASQKIEENFALFRRLLGKKPNWEIPIKLRLGQKNSESVKLIVNSHVCQLLKLLTSSEPQIRQKVHDLFKDDKEITFSEIVDWIKKNRINSKRLEGKSEKKEVETFLGKQWTPETILENAKWQKDLKLSPSFLNSKWGPKSNLSPHWETREMFIRAKFRWLLKLLYDQDPRNYFKVKEIFKKEKVKDEEMEEFIQLQPVKPILKIPKDLSERKQKKLLRTNQLFTFKVKLEGNYQLFDGEKQLSFVNSNHFLNHLVKIAVDENKNIILFGHNVLNLGSLQHLIQEAITKKYLPTLTVRGKDTTKKKLASCYLKGDQIIVKDWTAFTDFNQKNKLEQKEDLKNFEQDRHNLRNLYHQIQKLDKQTFNKYQFSLLDKKVTSRIRIAWKDFWNTFEKEKEEKGWENIWDFSEQEDEFIRKAYRGGYLDLFNEQNYSGTVTDWDFKSFYPFLMAKYPFPISRPEWIDHPKLFYGENWKEIFYGYYKCEVECLKNNPYPFFNFRKVEEKGDESSWIYRPGKYKTVLFSEEIKFFWKNTPQIKIKVGGGYFFRSIQPIFHNWIRKLYKVREKGDEEAKIKMNSCYGMFGREKKHYKLEWSSTTTGDHLAQFWSPQKKKIYLNLSQELKSSWRFGNVAIAAAIVAYGRIKLYQACLANWDKLLYCSTDGLVLKGKEQKFKNEPIFESCGELQKKGEYEGFIVLAPNSYAFKEKKDNLVKGATLKSLTQEQVDYLFKNPITEENKEQIIKNAPNLEEWKEDLERIIEDTLARDKKNLVEGKWQIHKN